MVLAGPGSEPGTGDGEPSQRAPASVTPGPPPTGAVLAEPDDPSLDAEPPATATAVVWIDIDPAPKGNTIDDRLDVLIVGRARSSRPIAQITLAVDDNVVSAIQYALPDQGASIDLPDGTPGRLYPFVLNLQQRQDAGASAFDCVVSAETDSAGTYIESFDIASDPTSPHLFAVRSGPTWKNDPPPKMVPPIMLYVERAAIDQGRQITLRGWAVAMAELVTVQLFIRDQLVGAAVLGQTREEIGQAFPSYPNARRSGFTFTGLLHGSEPPPQTIALEAISRNGVVYRVVVPILCGSGAGSFGDALQNGLQLGVAARLPVPSSASVLTAAPDPRREIYFCCDAATLNGDGILSVTGWAVCATSIAAVAIELDDSPVGEATLGMTRLDVGELYGTIAMARVAGFQFEQHVATDARDEHKIRIIVRNGWDDVREEFVDLQISSAMAEPAPPASGEADSFRLEIDNPKVVGGTVRDPLTGRMTIEGWVLARSGLASLAVHLDDRHLGDASIGLARPDVGAAFPGVEGSVRSGFAYHCPPRALVNGEHLVRLTATAKDGQVLTRCFKIEVSKSDDLNEHARIRTRMKLVEADLLARRLEQLDHHPRFRLVLRHAMAADGKPLLATLQSLRNQPYRDWELVILAADAEAGDIASLLGESAPDLAAQLRIITPDDAAFDATLAGAESGQPLLVGPLTAGDALGVDALIGLAVASALHLDVDMFYADEVRISPASGEREPFFKPDWSPDLLLSSNYIGRLWVARPAPLRKAAATPRDLQVHGDYDLVLRCTEHAAKIHHVPTLLCQRGQRDFDDPAIEHAALLRAAERRGIAAEVLPGRSTGGWRFRRTAPSRGKVSIIIPTCAAHGYIETCIASLRAHTAYRDHELVCIDNIASENATGKDWLRNHADRIVDVQEAFNWSRFNNLATEQTDGDYLLFLNDDIEIVQDDWLDVLLENIARPEVGIVGARLLYPDRTIQHAGMFLATNGIARHAFRFAADGEPGYFGLASMQRNVLAVTGACMLVRRDVFDALGRFDEAHAVVNNDLDLCLRAHRAGFLTVFTPHATLIHHELASRDKLPDSFDSGRFEQQWKTLFAGGDPYFSPWLSPHSDDVRPEDEPVETVHGGYPLFRPEEIKRILVVKLDHIGDFITALPAIRDLKAAFPAASIHVMAPRAAQGFAAGEPAIDGFIDFAFFHARSELGSKKLTADDFLSLRTRLAPYRFDLAVDLRKHPDTREVLRYVPARFLAGFDYSGQFGFLDIALEWEADRNLQSKRSHVVDDLRTLVAAIGVAGRPERNRIAPPAGPRRGPPDSLPAAARPLFKKPVVAIHPAVGTIMRQWPAEHFGALIDLLIERNDVNVVLIGGPDETETGSAVLDNVIHRDRVASLIGTMPLADLPALLTSCVLFVGNNSGPKHIAAALGVPSIGIHSGVVDATEWAPVGDCAVAVRRSMTCSPCYLALLQDCPRDLACLRQLAPEAVYRVAETFLAGRAGTAGVRHDRATAGAASAEVKDAARRRQRGAARPT